MEKKIKSVVIDLDGVVYQGSELIEKADKAILKLRHFGVDVQFLTNNSVRKRSYLLTKLQKMGVPIESSELLTSPMSIASYLKSSYSKGASVLSLGSLDFKEELLDLTDHSIRFVEDEMEAEILIASYNPDFNYELMGKGLRALLNGAHFIASNIDRNFPVDGGRRVPGAGAIVNSLIYASNRSVDFIGGKPNPYLLTEYAKKKKIDLSEMAMVGDTVESDMVMAENAGALPVFITKKREGHYLQYNSLYDFVEEGLHKSLFQTLS